MRLALTTVALAAASVTAAILAVAIVYTHPYALRVSLAICLTTATAGAILAIYGIRKYP